MDLSFKREEEEAGLSVVSEPGNHFRIMITKISTKM